MTENMTSEENPAAVPEDQNPEAPEDQAPDETDDATQSEDAPEAAKAEEAVEETEGEPEPELDGEALQAEIADLNDKLLRAMAETENVRRRAERDKEDASKYAIANFAREMVTVSDNLARALGSIDADARSDNPALDQLLVGLEMTERGIQTTFERFGIKVIEAMGEKFDHNLHEAMFEMDDATKPSGTVVQVVETGYVLKDRLLRPAKVGVSKGGSAPSADKPKDEPASPASTPEPEPDQKEGQAAYEDKGGEPGAQLDEEL